MNKNIPSNQFEQPEKIANQNFRHRKFYTKYKSVYQPPQVILPNQLSEISAFYFYRETGNLSKFMFPSSKSPLFSGGLNKGWPIGWGGWSRGEHNTLSTSPQTNSNNGKNCKPKCPPPDISGHF